jgi:ATP-grasp domain/L-amino acid ligase C-terminal domain 2/ATP-grasp N-terminal domain
MPRVLLLATTTGYQTRAFGAAAEELGVRLVFATDRCHQLDDPWQDHAIPIRFHEERASADAIVEAAAGDAIDGIVTVGDRPTVIAARVAACLGLPAHPVEAAEIARDKERTRERLREAGLPVPWFVASRIDVDSQRLAARVSYPCVVKPVALSGSRGVMRADNARELRAALDRLRALVGRPELLAERNERHDRVLIEGFIPGREFALEGLLHHGALHVLALFDKPDPLDGPFFEETIYLTPSSLDADGQRRVIQAVGQAAAAIGLRHGPIHAECRVNDGGVFVLEVAARPIGGLCSRALRFTGTAQRGRAPFSRDRVEKGVRPLFSLEELLLRHALGEPPDGWAREAAASGVMMIPIPGRGVYRGVDGVAEARLVTGIDDVAITAKTDQVLVPLPEGASYLGFIFAHGDATATVDHALRDAHARLRFAIEPELRVVQSTHGSM